MSSLRERLDKAASTEIERQMAPAIEKLAEMQGAMTDTAQEISQAVDRMERLHRSQARTTIRTALLLWGSAILIGTIAGAIGAVATYSLGWKVPLIEGLSRLL